MTTVYLEDEAATVAWGEALAARLESQYRGDACIYLQGDLGAGKTTLVRGVLRGFGYDGAVKSPTYTLLEPYTLARGLVYHLDLYRIGHGEELTFVGLDELLQEAAVKLIEWPDRGAGYLPPADIVLTLTVAGSGRQLEERIL